MSVDDAITALMDTLAANAMTVNEALEGTGYSVRLDLGTAEEDSSAFRYIKRGDRMKLPDGLTICFVPESSRRSDYLGANTSEKTITIQIVAYLVNEKDPDKRERARYAVADALRSLYNRKVMRTLETGAGTLYNCEVGEEVFRYLERQGETRMGQVAATVVLTWTGLYYVEETDTHG